QLCLARAGRTPPLACSRGRPVITVSSRRLPSPVLPERYAEPWRQPFYDRVASVISPGSAIVDVGSGRSPAVPVDLRPPDCRYVGLDISASELAAAAPCSYDEAVVADLLAAPEGLSERFD